MGVWYLFAGIVILALLAIAYALLWLVYCIVLPLRYKQTWHNQILVNSGLGKSNQRESVKQFEHEIPSSLIARRIA